MPKKTISNELFQKAVDKWFLIYAEKNEGENYAFQAKDGLHLKQLLNKIRRKHLDKELAIEDENLLDSFAAYVGAIRDPWVLDNFTIPILNSKFNEIYIKIKRRNPGNTIERLRAKWSN